MIVLAVTAVVLAVLAVTAYAINHVPLDLLHTLAAQIVTAVVTVVALAELFRFRIRRDTRTNTTPGETHA